jgi:hypothetical protein
MKTLTFFVVWCILLVVAWPLALVVLVVAPLVWLLALPFCLAGLVLGAALAFVKAVLFLPARIMGYRG